jgi:anti-anti-sigma factor
MGIVPRPCIVELSGDFDVNEAGTVDEQLRRLPAAADLIVDLSRVGFFGAAGLNLLMTLSHRLAENEAGLCLVGAPSTVRRLILLLGLQDALPCQPVLPPADETGRPEPLSRPRQRRAVPPGDVERPVTLTRLLDTRE